MDLSTFILVLHRKIQRRHHISGWEKLDDFLYYSKREKTAEVPTIFISQIETIMTWTVSQLKKTSL